MTTKITIINDFLNRINEQYLFHTDIHSGTDSSCYNVNGKYFLKIKSAKHHKSEAIYYKKYIGAYHPKLIYIHPNNDYIVYNLLDAYDIKDATNFENIIDIVLNYTKSAIDINVDGYGYIVNLKKSWAEYLENDLNHARNDLKEILPQKDFILVNKAIKYIASLPAPKKLIHGDLGLHNVMGKNNKVVSIIDPCPCIGDPLYDFVSFVLSNLSIIKLLPIDKIATKVDDDKDKVVAMITVVLVDRLRRVRIWNPQDFYQYMIVWNNFVKSVKCIWNKI